MKNRKLFILMFQIMASVIAVIHLINKDHIPADVWFAAAMIMACINLSTTE